jgi:AAA15 family ATPase/GTPase
VNFSQLALKYEPPSLAMAPVHVMIAHMLLSFSVTNFRSFRDKQTLSMVASNRHADHPEHLTAIPNDENKALPVAAIYGANGGGKSNFVKALQRFQNLVCEGTKKDSSIERSVFALDERCKREPTEMEVQFVNDGRAFVYGAKFLDDRVAEEWLSEMSAGRETQLFQRMTDESGRTEVDYPKPDRMKHPKLEALRVVQGAPNQLFLHTIKSNLTFAEYGDSISPVLDWFGGLLRIIEASSIYSSLTSLVAEDEGFSSLAGAFLKEIGSGVERVATTTSALDDQMKLPKVLLEQLMEKKAKQFHHVEKGLMLERGPDGKPLIRELKCEHVTSDGKGSVALPFEEESDGTRRLLHLLPVLHDVSTNGKGTYIIDEIDRSLHPLLTKGFVRAFLEKATGKGGQLIFTTHDTNLLDPKLLRRDEIWFADKKLPAGATDLYSLADFKVRTDLKFDKAYLEARFGAVPPMEIEMPDWVSKVMDGLRSDRQEGKTQ